mmetsp:Transcript_17442/g.52142  ORF Transcript_17442/g.52142 Transcript_17442/m.52142 type:complete len:94 (-) Transcript_17442:1545-1826(-)
MTSFGRLVVLLESSHSPSLPSMLSSSFRGLLTLFFLAPLESFVHGLRECHSLFLMFSLLSESLQVGASVQSRLQRLLAQPGGGGSGWSERSQP